MLWDRNGVLFRVGLIVIQKEAHAHLKQIINLVAL